MANHWYVTRAGKETGPLTGQRLKEMAASGEIKPTDLVRREDMQAPRQASTIKGLFPAEGSMAPPRTTKLPPETTPPARRSESRSKLLLLFGAGGLVLLLVGLGIIGALAKKGRTKDEQVAQPDAPSAGTGQGSDFPTDDPRYAVEVPDFSKVDYAFDFSKDDYNTIPSGSRRTTRERKREGEKERRLNGRVETQEGYVASDGMFTAHGQFTTWYDKDGKRKLREGTMRLDKLHGVVTYYFENGEKHEELVFVDGQRHGVWKTWHPNGQLAIVNHYLSDQRHGIGEGWYKNGQKEFEYTFVEDKKHGPQKEWWDNGNRMRIDPRKDGVRHGHYADWENDGQPGASGLFEDGRPVGRHRLAYVEARTGKRYYLDVDDQPWKGGTVAEFIAKMHYTSMRTRPQVSFQFDPRAGIATFVADSERQFFELFGRPSRDTQDPEKQGVPVQIRDQYRLWRYDLADGSLNLRVQPTQDRTLLVTAKR